MVQTNIPRRLDKRTEEIRRNGKDTHANLLPTPILLQKTCHQAAIRLATLPQRHPLHPHLKHVVKHQSVFVVVSEQEVL